MLITNFALGSIAVVAMIPAIAVTQWGRVLIKSTNQEILRRNSAINSQLAEYIRGLRIVRAFGLEEWTTKNLGARVTSHLQTNIRLNRFNAAIRPTVGFLTTLPLLSILGWGGWHALHQPAGTEAIRLGAAQLGAVQMGLIVTFIRYCDRFSRPIVQLSQDIQMIQAAFSSAERVAVFLKEHPESVANGADGEIVASKISGKIEFKNVFLSYGKDISALKGATFTIEAGETVGFAGRTGSGKTTTVSILTRLYQYQQGVVLLDGIPLTQYSRRSLRRHIGFVSQDAILFAGTIRENLSVDSECTDETILHSCEQTGLTELLRVRGLSLADTVDDSGANFSAGERQLIAFTRVLITNPAILILDEATANIDPYTEKLIHNAVDLAMKDRTCIIIAHRLATIKTCDKLVLFKEGQIVESGSPETLLESGGYYSQLVTAAAAQGSIG